MYSALAVVDDAVEPLSQSLSVARLFTLPVNDSTESQLEAAAEIRLPFHMYMNGKENKTNPSVRVLTAGIPLPQS